MRIITAGWNSRLGPAPDATFVYYKEFLDGTCLGPAASCSTFSQPGQPNRIRTLPPMAINMASAQRWRNDHCADYAGIATLSNELDMARFLWGINTGPSALNMDNIYGIFRTMCGGSQCNSSMNLQWQQLVADQDPNVVKSMRSGALNWFGGSLQDARFLFVDTQGINHGITLDLTPTP